MPATALSQPLKKSSLISLCILCFLLLHNTLCKAQNGKLTIPVGHNQTVKMVSVSPNGKFLLSFSEDNSIVLWDKNRGSIIRKMYMSGSAITAVRFLSDSQYGILMGTGKFLAKDIATNTDVYNVQCKAIVNDFYIANNNIHFFYKKAFLGIGALVNGNEPENTTIEVRKITGGTLITTFKGRYHLLTNSSNGTLITVGNKNQLLTYNKQYQQVGAVNCPGDIVDILAEKAYTIASLTDGRVIKIDHSGNTALLVTEKEKVSAVAANADANMLFTACRGTLRAVNMLDTAASYKISYKVDIEDIHFDPSSPEMIYAIFSNGMVAGINYKTKKGNVYEAHTGWNAHLLSTGKGEFISYNDNDYFYSWKTAPLRVASSFNGYTGSISYVGYDTVFGKILSRAAGSALHIRNDKELQQQPSGIKHNILNVSPLYADSLCLLACNNNTVLVYDFKNNRVIDSVQINNDKLQQNFISSPYNNKAILLNDEIIVQTLHYNGTVIFWNKDKSILSQQYVHGIDEVVASPYQTHILLKGNGIELYRFEENGDLTLLLKDATHMDKATFSDDENYIVYTKANSENTVHIYSIKDKTSKQVLTGAPMVTCISQANSRNKIVIATFDDVHILNVKTGLAEKATVGNLGPVNSVTWKNNDICILAGEDGRLTFYDDSKKKVLYTRVIFNDEREVITTPDGYYFGDKNKTRLLKFVDGLKINTFEQLDIKYNRPDKVLEAMGSTDTTLISLYKKAYEKRLKKLGIDARQFKTGYSVPEADFKNRDVISYEQQNRQLLLHITANDKTYPLHRFNVWVNECPVFGMQGITFANNRRSIDTTLTIDLSAGDNRIETSVTNINGIESYRTPLYVKYEPQQTITPKLYFVGIGTDKFVQKENNLAWSVKDIRDLAAALKIKHGQNIVIDTLFNQNVTVANVSKLKIGLLNSNVNDKVIIAFSGHGVLSQEYDYFLSTHDIDFYTPEKNGLPYDALEALADGIPARQKLILIDACHSGEVDKDEAGKIAGAGEKLAQNNILGAKGFKPKKNTGKKAGMKNSFELMQEVFANVGRSTGATVISAAAGTQFAFERNELKNGVFTYSILEFMRANNHAPVSSLQQYVNQRVTQLTAGLQVPTTRAQVDHVNWTVW